MHRSLAVFAALTLAAPLTAQLPCTAPVDPYDSGGRLDPQEAAYDVHFYDLAVAVRPADSTITGQLELHATIVSPAAVVALDLDTLLRIDSVQSPAGSSPTLPFTRCGGRVRVELPRTLQPGEALRLRVT
ncbi:MAG: hypothetical protein OER21_15355, partial [Gemmatimonadota bacterium]|nr:hypothetical protein [Gemmatimonadota bacterium]